jgi:hypothetical protein
MTAIRGLPRCARRIHDEVTWQLGLAEGYLDQWATIVTWWRGTRLEGAWGHIHNAKVGLIELMNDAQIAAYSTQVLALANKYLNDGDPERVPISGWHDRDAERVDGHQPPVRATSMRCSRRSRC